MSFRKIAQLRTTEDFRTRLAELGLDLPVDDHVLSTSEGSPLAEPLEVGGLRIGNRWCIHPMEGWDANTDGSPTELTLRRWRRFGQSGAKLIWGGEAAAVRPDGRANPNQTMAIAENEAGLIALRTALVEEHASAFGPTDDLLIGLQLTHSGRFCRPYRKDLLEPKIAYHHPILDARFGIASDDDSVVWTDDEIEALIEDYVNAARLAERCGYQFVDIKSCHGYLLHEFLSAHHRPGKYGGDFEGRTRLLLTIIARVQEACPGLGIGVRLSLFDILPYEQGESVGQPASWDLGRPYEAAFGCDVNSPTEMNLGEPFRLIASLEQAGVRLLNLSCGSPYYNPHIQRPAIFPPSDGYQPPEDPLVGVARQIHAVRRAKEAFPGMIIVGSGYTYLQDYLPQVAQAVVRRQWVDSVGLGRMVLSYPTMPADSLAGVELQRKLVCRTFSDCTSGPRLGMVSGCYPLDEYYKRRPERERLVQLKRER